VAFFLWRERIIQNTCQMYGRQFAGWLTGSGRVAIRIDGWIVTYDTNWGRAKFWGESNLYE
jgi:hypothetical protein